MQRLIYTCGAPERSISRCQLLRFGVPTLPPVDVKMNDGFSNDERDNKIQGCRYYHKYDQASDRMYPGMQTATKMQVLAAAFQHHLGLQEIIGQHMFDLQQAQQDHDCAHTFNQTVSSEQNYWLPKNKAILDRM